jgi:hypothetical protein
MQPLLQLRPRLPPPPRQHTLQTLPPRLQRLALAPPHWLSRARGRLPHQQLAPLTLHAVLLATPRMPQQRSTKP